MKVKSTRPEDKKKGVIYEVPCAECNCVYVGKTGRSLEVRLKEHRYAVKTKVHADTNNHKVDGEAARVILFKEHQTKRKVLESLQINRPTPLIWTVATLSPIWKPLLN